MDQAIRQPDSAPNLPDPLQFSDGSRITTWPDWLRRREELKQLILDYEHTGFPPPPDRATSTLLLAHTLRWSNIRHEQYKVICGSSGSLSFIADLKFPETKAPYPTIVCGDGCWRYLTDAVVQKILSRGYCLAEFNRLEFSPDLGTKNAGLFLQYPNAEFGAIAAWAWGIHRCVDFLQTHDQIDRSRIAVMGHSRGGKAALLAGALDERIALIAPNGSGCGGAAPFRQPSNGAERLGEMFKTFPLWFSPKLRPFIDHADQLPFDHNQLIALCAPRPFITTEAAADLWADPAGTRANVESARTVYQLAGKPDLISMAVRQGGHAHTIEDVESLLNFADRVFK